jgi:hypothetical protein
MKNLRTCVLCACITFIHVSSFAQNSTDVPINEPNWNKPKLFQNLPDYFPVDVDNLMAMLTSQTGADINVNLSAESTLPFQGKVISSASKYDNAIYSVVIRSTNFEGAKLTISRITNPDGSIKYSGRLMSMQHGDLYELQNRENRLFLVKRNFYDLVNE